MGSSMEDIKELRKRTGAGVLDCKKALQKKEGDLEAAVEYLREKGIAEADKKSGRVAAQGKVNVLINEERSEGLVVEINCETDFVAKNDKFQQLVDEISRHIMQSEAGTVEKILDEEWYRDNSKTVNRKIKESIAGIGENINLRRFSKFTADGFLQGYIHMGGKIGVLVDIDGEYTEENENTAKNIAMQIAASDPEFLSRSEVSDEVINRERKIFREQMLNEGKPEHIIDQIVDGKMDKLYTQICLLEQPYVRDTDLSVADYLEDKDIEINRYVRYELGEGIDTGEEDFAAEVKAEINKEK